MQQKVDIKYHIWYNSIIMKIGNYQLIKFKCKQCGEGQYYSKGEPIQCPYCGAKNKQVLVEVEYISNRR